MMLVVTSSPRGSDGDERQAEPTRFETTNQDIDAETGDEDGHVFANQERERHGEQEPTPAVGVQGIKAERQSGDREHGALKFGARQLMQEGI